MIVKFALDTLNEVANGDLNSRVRAVLAFGLWFTAGAFLVSTAQFYFASAETTLASVLGGVATAVLAVFVKTT